MAVINNLKYLLFIDESGKSKLTDMGDSFLLSGFIIEKGLHDAINKLMLDFKNKHNINTDQNIHAFELFEKESIKNKKLTHTQISLFFKHLISLISMSDFKTILFKIDKRDLRNRVIKLAKKKKVSEKEIHRYMKRNGDQDVLYEILVTKVVHEFSKTLAELRASGSIIAETRAYNDEALIKGFKSAIDKNKYTENSLSFRHAKTAYENISSLTFENKKAVSYGLEVSDLFAWAKLNEKEVLRFAEYSNAKLKRVKARIKEVNSILKDNKQNKVQNIKLDPRNEIVGNRVSRIIKDLESYRIDISGDPMR
jgi:hypothetical protein